MTPYTGLCLILLTYKGKVLLLQQENVLNIPSENTWHFIKKIKGKDTSAEKTIIQEVHNETHVTLDNISLLSSVLHEDTMQYVFHAKLSDSNVNSIQRGEGRLLQFFGINELNKLQMQSSTKSFFLNNRVFLETLAAN